MYIPPHLRNKNIEQMNIPIIKSPVNEMSWIDKIKITKEKEKKKKYPAGYMIFEKKDNIIRIVQNDIVVKNDIVNNLYVSNRHNEYDIEDSMKDLNDGYIYNHDYDNEISHLEC